MTYEPRIDPITGEEYIAVDARGRALLADPLTNKGTAFPLAERERLGLYGLVPPAVSTLAQQLERAYENFTANGMFLDAAKGARCAGDRPRSRAPSVYAELGRIRSCSHAVARAVIRRAVEEGHASASILDRLEEKVGRAMWIPEYRPLWYSAGRRETDRHIAVERELRA